MSVPDIGRLERDAELLHAEIDRQLDEARQLLREHQDAAAEDSAFATAKLWLTGLRFGDVGQRFLIAQCELVSPSDRRFAAAQRTSADLRDRLVGGPLRSRIRRHARSRLRVREEAAAA